MLQSLDDAIQTRADNLFVRQIFYRRFPERAVGGEFLNCVLAGFAAFDVQFHRLGFDV
jgi:hypothetical protein